MISTCPNVLRYIFIRTSEEKYYPYTYYYYSNNNNNNKYLEKPYVSNILLSSKIPTTHFIHIPPFFSFCPTFSPPLSISDDK